MISTLVTFTFDENFNEEAVRKTSEASSAKFVNMPGLRSKAFTISPETKQAKNFYVWEDEASAKNFFSEQTMEGVTKLYGVRPSLDFLELITLVDNATS